MCKKIKSYCYSNNYGLNIKLNDGRSGLFGQELDNILSNTKIVIHIPILENLQTFPWAKCIKLFNNKVFVLIEDNNEVEILKAKGLNVATYNPNIEDDIFNKIDKYLNDDNLRNQHIESCYNFMRNNYIMEDLIKTLF